MGKGGTDHKSTTQVRQYRELLELYYIYQLSRDTYEYAFADGRSEVPRFCADERLYGDHYAKTSPVYDVYRLFHGRKSLLVQREVAHFRLPEFVQQHVTYNNNNDIILTAGTANNVRLTTTTLQRLLK